MAHAGGYRSTQSSGADLAPHATPTGTATHELLDTTFAGELLGPDDPGYDRARQVFNGVFDKRPALIARCSNAADVRIALAHAREQHLVVAVRGGGHSLPGHSSCDGGLVIDTSPMKRVQIDPRARTGRFGAGLTWAEFDAATQAHGLAVTGGRVSHTGVAGLTLGSGSGWLERVCGTTCENLISAELVTADGRLLRVSNDENAELFWGIKGGGGNFGIVTEFEFHLHPVGPIVYAGMILHPRAAAGELLRFFRDFMETAPDEVTGAFAMITAPPLDTIPEPARGQAAAGLIVMYVGDSGDGETALRPLLDWGAPWLSMVQPMPYTAVQAINDGANPWGICEYAKYDYYLPELPDDAIDTLVAKAAQAHSPLSGVYLGRLGGALNRSDHTTMALELPAAKWFYFCEALWWDHADANAEIAWAQALKAAMSPWSTDKALPNFISADEGQARLRASYGNDKYQRLVNLKNSYDPTNILALNPNITPTATPRS